MEKLLYLVWRPEGSDPEGFVRAVVDDLGPALVDLGARDVQVNVADEAVAGAMLRFAFTDPQPAAVASFWLPSANVADRGPYEELIAGHGRRVAGYLVTESEPLADAHRVPPGERTPGFANIALLRRPIGLDRAEWLRRWLDGHTPIATSTQSTFRYVQHVVVRPFHDDGPELDGVVEECFPIEALADLHAFFDSQGDDEELGRRMTVMGESTARFIDDTRLDLIPTSQHRF